MWRSSKVFAYDRFFLRNLSGVIFFKLVRIATFFIKQTTINIAFFLGWNP